MNLGRPLASTAARERLSSRVSGIRSSVGKKVKRIHTMIWPKYFFLPNTLLPKFCLENSHPSPKFIGLIVYVLKLAVRRALFPY